MTITVPLIAFDDLTASAIALAATHWISRSIVKRIEVPASVETISDCEPGISAL